jgi:hypothetical protein
MMDRISMDLSLDLSSNLSGGKAGKSILHQMEVDIAGKMIRELAMLSMFDDQN